jgi:hypothetical protein
MVLPLLKIPFSVMYIHYFVILENFENFFAVDVEPNGC